MNIKKDWLVENILREDDQETTLDDINPSEAPVSEIADAIQNSVEEISDEERTVPDEAAEKAAQEISTTAKEINAGGVALDSSVANDKQELLGVENALTHKLDQALRVALSGRRQGSNKNANVLITGLPGSGKTSIVYDWAATGGRNINIFAVSAADPDLEDAVYGLTMRDTTVTDKNVTTKATTTFLDKLDKENSVLFLDEFNRAKASLRRALLTLVNEHTVPDPSYPNGNRPFPNLLFTVACINPGGLRTDKTAELLSDAEKSRFGIKATFDSNTETALDYFTKHWDKLVNKLDPTDPYYKEDLAEYLKTQDLGMYIVSHPDFHFDGRDVLDELSDNDKTMLNMRSLTDGLNVSGGDVKEFRTWLLENSEYLDQDIKMISRILDSYQQPRLEDLMAAKNAAAPQETPIEEPTEEQQEETAAEAEAEEEIEDDDDFFAKAATGKSAMTPGEVEAAMIAAMSNW